ncbi:hypothetical protein Bca4012_060762 [Brassica carinata]
MTSSPLGRPAISGYCSSLFSWTDSIDKWLMCGFSKNLWLRRGNVGGRSLCLTSATASLSNLVKLIYLNAVVKVARPSLSGNLRSSESSMGFNQRRHRA